MKVRDFVPSIGFLFSFYFIFMDSLGVRVKMINGHSNNDNVHRSYYTMD